MQRFLDEHFLLTGKTAQRLYHEFAAGMPVIDYHCHLPPEEIAEDRVFENITQAWLYGDHYKWRAMRANGIPEVFCTGNASDADKFKKWAETVPYTLRNPLYHWTHLELQRYFDCSDLLAPDTAAHIYDHCNERLRSPGYSVRQLLQRMKVEVVCTTDDPVDSLGWHRQLRATNDGLRVFPAFRPDKAMNAEDAVSFNVYAGRLEEAANTSIGNFDQYLQALRSRHDYFASVGCTVSDHGLDQLVADSYSQAELETIFAKLRAGKDPDKGECRKFRSALLYELALWDWEAGWVQQFHLGALRNTNSRALRTLGGDTGWDSIGDLPQANALAAFLDRLDSTDRLAKTIIYNLNPADNELMAALIGSFNDGASPGKIQYGSAWWFLDQKDGMTRQLNALSNLGLLSRFVGMLTDSRSFLSYPRHEYFRRILCNLFGEEIDRGELPGDIPWIGQIISDICYTNAKNYFGW
ncbi:MAG: glucuronate isomerase [Bacteroidota bacterium]|nr:glucuronate isomerase [Bacteroidota bacterium]MDP4216344.1 glucuronate isomerase [Bacteroidota bacterium]MDP4246837.1 glucuronate isomerase [Bacteroidota bacterium]MDP4254879.1 glucuronate isomerase [Bacteroidota bacterium]MDP4257195.1 glucuronate isomerase [Bacteroidota bacterium]